MCCRPSPSNRLRDTSDKYRLRPSSMVGALEIGDMSVLIEPKIGIPQLLSLGLLRHGRVQAPRAEALRLPEGPNATRCTGLGADRGGPPSIWARTPARIPDRRRRAAHRARAHPFRRADTAKVRHSPAGRTALRRVHRGHPGQPAGEGGGDSASPHDPALVRGAPGLRAGLPRSSRMSRCSNSGERNVPEVRFDRLNEHYRHVVGLARLILLHSEFESFRGDVRASGFLIDMNKPVSRVRHSSTA